MFVLKWFILYLIHILQMHTDFTADRKQVKINQYAFKADTEVTVCMASVIHYIEIKVDPNARSGSHELKDTEPCRSINFP